MIKNLIYSLVQALTLIVWLHFLINCLNNRFFKPYCSSTQNWTFRISEAEFQRQGHTGGRISLFLHTGYELLVFKLYVYTTVLDGHEIQDSDHSNKWVLPYVLSNEARLALNLWGKEINISIYHYQLL